MIAAISPADINFDETLSTLRYVHLTKIYFLQNHGKVTIRDGKIHYKLRRPQTPLTDCKFLDSWKYLHWLISQSYRPLALFLSHLASAQDIFFRKTLSAAIPPLASFIFISFLIHCHFPTCSYTYTIIIVDDDNNMFELSCKWDKFFENLNVAVLLPFFCFLVKNIHLSTSFRLCWEGREKGV